MLVVCEVYIYPSESIRVTVQYTVVCPTTFDESELIVHVQFAEVLPEPKDPELTVPFAVPITVPE